MLIALAWITGALLVLALVGGIAFRVSHWPGALTIRLVFNRGGGWLASRLKRHVPQGVRSMLDIAYAPADRDARLDVFMPQGTLQEARLPVLVWVHGGGFVSGDKSHVAPYLRIFAAEGVLAIGINYALAPEIRYPAPLAHINAAMGWVRAHVDALGGDATRIVIAGDSAGAQLAAQYAAIVTDPACAARLGVTPALSADALRGVLLFCGFFDAVGLVGRRGFAGAFTRTLLRSYLGAVDPADPRVVAFSTLTQVGPTFPPTFITVGNGDLLDSQSRALADRLGALGVSVETLFYPADHRPRLPHEYQYDFDGVDGPAAFARAVAFLKACTGKAAAPPDRLAAAGPETQPAR